MKRAVYFVAVMLILIISSVYAVYAKDIKVGLGSVQTYTTDGKLDIGYVSGGEYIDCGYVSDYSYLTFRATQGAYYRSKDIFGSFSSAKQYAEKFASAYPAVCGKDSWYVYSEDPADGFEGSVLLGTTALFAYEGDAPAFITDLPSNTLLSKIDGSFMEYAQNPYRGKIELFSKNGGLVVINYIDMEDYLRGVVPAEMPASWHGEALKAQAVASRTYALYSVQKHAAEGYNVCTSQHCQVYKGVRGENSASDAAVKETVGVAMYYGSQPINAVFTSSSGGFTASSVDVWGGSVPYLKGIKDGFDTQNEKWTRTFTLDQLTNMAGDIGNVTSLTLKTGERSGRVKELLLTGTGGTKSYTGEKIRTFFSSAGGSLKSTRFTFDPAGPVMYSPQGTTKSASPQASATLKVLSGSGSLENISVGEMYLNNSSGAAKSEPQSIINGSFAVSAIQKEIPQSSVASVSEIPVETSDGEGLVTSYSAAPEITIYGAGYGHGVGMSQYGAKRMAEMGYNFIQILKFYYKGVAIDT